MSEQVENHRPEIEASGKALAAGTTINVSTMFSVRDENGDSMTAYQLWDSGAGSGSGHFTVNGAVQAAGTLIAVSPSDIGGVTYTAGTTKGSEDLWVRAYDGTEWSEWKKWSVETTGGTTGGTTNTVPTVNVTGSTQTVGSGSSVTASSLFSVTDDDGSPTRYEFWDSGSDDTSGYFSLDDQREGANQVISVGSDELSRLNWVGGSGEESAWVRVFDGTNWSEWTEWTMSSSSGGVENHAPEIDASGKALAAGSTVNATTMFSVRDENGDSMTAYQLWDSGAGSGSGHFTVNGVVQSAGTLIEVAPSNIGGVTFTAGTTNGSEDLWVRAYDGTEWSEWKKWSVETTGGTTNAVPTVNVTGSTQTVGSGSSVTASSLFSVTDDDGSPTRYEFWDSGSDDASGYFSLDDQREGANQVISVGSDELSRLNWVGGSGEESAWVRVFDGTNWSEWTEWTMSSSSGGVENHAPEIDASGKALTVGSTVNATTMFSVRDENGDSMTAYQLWDSGTGSGSGHFTVNGVVQAAGTLIAVTPSEIAGVTFTAGTTIGSEDLWVRANDGTEWSEWKKWTVETKAGSAAMTTQLTTTDADAAKNLFLAV